MNVVLDTNIFINPENLFLMYILLDFLYPKNSFLLNFYDLGNILERRSL